MMSLVISILPNILYLLVLKTLDSFALARLKLVLRNMLLGVIWCALAFALTNPACLGIPVSIKSISLMPLVEEILKAVVLACLIIRHKFRFMAQCLIYGAAIGSGFSLVENIIYFFFTPTMAFGTAIVRGFGCAILHMGCTALFATLLMTVLGKFNTPAAVTISIIPPAAIHFLHNWILENDKAAPILVLTVTVAVFIVLFVLLFSIGERKINKWMDRSINNDIRTLSDIRNGNFSSTKEGEYLLKVKEQFQPEVFFDMICYLQLSLELKIDKQSEMLLRQAGFGDEIIGNKHKERNAKKSELKSLSDRIGKTGIMILNPLVKDTV